MEHWIDMIKETKMGEIILQEQSTYYVYANEEAKKKGIWMLSTSSHHEAAKFAFSMSKNNKQNES